MDLLHVRLAKYDLPQKMMEKGVYPYFREIEGKQGTEVEMGGKHVLMFGSNAYTGLTGDQRIIDAAKAALDKYGSGCAGSRFLNGTLDLHVKLEKELAEIEANKKKELTDDLLKEFEEKVQKITDKFTAEVDKVCEAKNKELMEI